MLSNRSTRRYGVSIDARSIPRTLCIALCALVLWYVGFGLMPAQTVPIGGDSNTLRRGLDEPFLRGFWGAEPAEWQRDEPAYRWTTTDWSITWPHAGVGFFVSSITLDSTPYSNPEGAIVTWQTPPLGPVATRTGQRRLFLLIRGDGNDARIVASMPALASTGDRRALGIVARSTTLSATTESWRPALIIVAMALLVMLWLAMQQWNVSRPEVWVACLAVMIGLSWHHDPLWWMVHISPIVISIGIASLAAVLITVVLLPRTADRVRWWWIIALGLGVVLLPTLSPYARTSDSAMHARMFFDVLRGNVYQLAELPCEASAWTVPYPPLIYILAAPFGITTWDRSSAWQMLQIGGHIAHVGAVIYLIRVAFRSVRCTPLTAMCVLVATWSSPFFQSVHIGELTNAWGHALYIVAIVSLFDDEMPVALRGLFGGCALLAHTGIAVTFGLTYGVYVSIRALQLRRIPWQHVLVGVGGVVGSILLYYSVYGALLDQPLKYPGCPPLLPIDQRFGVIASVLPGFFVLLTIIGAGTLNGTRLTTLVYTGLCVALISIAILIFRDQTVRWGMAVYPFGALAVGVLFQRIRRYGSAGALLMYTLFGAYTSMFLIQVWNRIYSYLH